MGSSRRALRTPSLPPLPSRRTTSPPNRPLPRLQRHRAPSSSYLFVLFRTLTPQPPLPEGRGGFLLPLRGGAASTPPLREALSRRLQMASCAVDSALWLSPSSWP